MFTRRRRREQDGREYAVFGCQRTHARTHPPTHSHTMSTTGVVPLEAQVIGASLHGVGFGFYSDNEAQSLSVCALTNPQTFDVLGNPLPGGLYDPALGPIDFQARCETCSLLYRHCPGHFGHIPLVLPVYHPILFRLLVKLMRATCLSCHRFKMRRSLAAFYQTKFRLLSEGWCALMELCMYMCVCTCMYARVCVFKHVCVCKHVRVCACMHVCGEGVQAQVKVRV
jgi:RNA polymerase Rpb1, domain 1